MRPGAGAQCPAIVGGGVQHTQRWLKEGVFEALVNDLRQLWRVAAGRKEQPAGAFFDSRPLQASPESGARAGDDGAKRRKRSKVQVAVDTLGQLLALRPTPANEQDREHVAALAAQGQGVTGQSVAVACVDHGSTGDQPLAAVAKPGIRLEVVKLPEVEKGCVLWPRLWVVERRFAWTARFRRLARDYERLPQTLAGLHFLAFAIRVLHRFIHLVVHGL